MQAGKLAAASLFATTAACAGDPSTSETVSAIDLDAFVLPRLDATERAAIVGKYDAVDPDDKVPRGLLEDALIYFDVNRAQLSNPDYITVADLSLHSGADRFWLVTLADGSVESHKVAHGDGSDPDNDGKATLFGNGNGSHMSSLGFYATGEIYDGTHVHSMRLDGLSVDGSPNGMANTNARDRFIVMHEASYVDDDNDTRQGRSNGCPALDPSIERGVVDRIHDGSLMYIATSSLDEPVGRGGTPGPGDDPNETGEPGETNDPGAETGEIAGGCSTGNGAGLVVALAAFALRRRRVVRSL